MRFHAVIPAWGERCAEVAQKFVIPSVRAAIAYAEADVRLIVYSDRGIWRYEIPGELRQLGPQSDDPALALQGTLRNLHHWTIAEAPPGSAAVLLNADTVVSREFFAVSSGAFARGCKVVAATALRTLIGRPPPVGVGAAELLLWAWDNRHPIAEGCVWGRGRTTFPNTVIFDRGDDVTLHSVHLHPFCVLSEGRALKFKGTIDDDLLSYYSDDEIAFIGNGEIGFAELSPEGFKGDQYRSGRQALSADAVVQFGRNCRWLPAHLRNFQQPIRIIGDNKPSVDKCITDICERVMAPRQR